MLKEKFDSGEEGGKPGKDKGGASPWCIRRGAFAGGNLQQGAPTAVLTTNKKAAPSAGLRRDGFSISDSLSALP